MKIINIEILFLFLDEAGFQKTLALSGRTLFVLSIAENGTPYFNMTSHFQRLTASKRAVICAERFPPYSSREGFAIEQIISYRPD